MGLVIELATDIIEDIRGSVAMYMFIVEEAIQAAGMAAYLSFKAQDYDGAKETAQWIIDNLIDPAIEFTDRYGYFAYPLQYAYSAFYQAARRTMEYYINYTPPAQS